MAESEDNVGANFLSVEIGNNPSIGRKRKVTFTEEIEVENLEKREELAPDEELEENVEHERVHSRLLNTPLWDFDACEGHVPTDKTFLVLRQQLKSGSFQVHRFSQSNSVYLFSPFNSLRLLAIRVTVNPYFELFVSIAIVVNCVFLALNDPPEEAEYVFSAIYTLEMLLVIIARGLVFNSHAYLRDRWNWLDFTVVILGYVTLAPKVANFTAIRAVRVLRALRTISAMEGLRTMVNSLLRSLKMLSDVLVLFLFFLCVMALIGLQLFVGQLRHKCVLIAPPHNLSVTRASNESLWYLNEGEPVICGNASTAGSCPENYTCVKDVGPNPNHGFTSFDHIGWALLMAFQLLTMDYWENLYNKVIRAMGAWYTLYFVTTIFFCSFYLMNLVLAVVYLSYEEEMKFAERKETKRKLSKKTDMTYFADEETLQHLVPLRENPTQGETLNDGEFQPLRVRTSPDNSRTKAEATGKVWKKNFTWICCSAQSSCGACLNRIPGWRRLRKSMNNIVSHDYFDIVIITLVLMNTIVLALYHHGIKPEFELILDKMNMMFTLIFVVEMLCKLVALGPVGYLKSKWNVFDGVIVITSVSIYFSDSGNGVSILWCLRLIRVLNLAQSWKTMGKLITAMTRSVGPVGNITVILGIIIYMFAIVGMNLFGNSYTPDKFGEDGVPRWNFKNFGHAFMLIFRILCGEWIEPLWDGMRATGPLAILYFLPIFIIGNFIVLNLFVALLLNAFDSHNDELQEEEDEPNESKLKRTFKRLTKTKKTRLFVATFKERYKFYEIELLESNISVVPPEQPVQEKSERKASRRVTNCTRSRCIRKQSSEEANRTESRDSIVEIDDCLPECCMCCSFSSRGHFQWLKWRCRIRCLVEHKIFEWFIISTVMFSSFVLVFEDVHLSEKPDLQKALDVLNYVFAATFSLEFILKFTGFGAVKYFSSPWNCLDAFIVSISLACLFENKQLSVFRSLRTLRALRPLRAVSRLEGMKVVINALFAAIPGIGNVLVVSLLFWLIFGILGVQLFSGKFFNCIDGEGNRVLADIIPNKTECVLQSDKYRWVNSEMNFDNVVNALMALFQVATFEGWLEVMQNAADATKVDHQPVEENNFVAYLFFILFIVVGSFFVLNLFIGVIIDNFNSLKKKYDEINSMGMLLTDTQRKWVNILKEAAKNKPLAPGLKPRDRFRRALYDVITGDRFEAFILMVIMLNMVTMMIQHYDQSEQVTSALRVCNLMFTGIFVAEAIIKLLVLRHYYFKKAWNVFDFIVVVSSVVGAVLDELNTHHTAVNPSLLRVLRIFRIARLLRFLEFAKGIRQLLMALIISIPALFNIGTLLFVIIFIFAIIGMATFGHVKKQGALDDIVNFETFGNSMMLLFRLSTSSGWNDIMTSLSVQPPHCDPDLGEFPNGNCGSFTSACLFLLSYVVVVFMIIVNMYIAVILENVSRTHENDFGLTKENFDSYYRKWASYVPAGKQFISLSKLADFVADLDKPFRIPKPNEAMLGDLDIAVRQGRLIHCYDLLKALVRRVLEEHGESMEAFEDISVKMLEQFTKSFARRQSIAILGSTATHFQEHQSTSQV